ncbi:MAG: glutathione S-transferase N-terminal domain-containing protein [Bdellovibrionales bacterium]|nr:glutathione S-transferase N-terminal domain-containing protein [Bdellovibrionales bacterium]
MIDLYYWTTPNGHKITIFLEEAQLPYKIHPIDIGKSEQFNPEFLKIAPNNRIPAIVDHEPGDNQGPLSLFESGAILWYLGEKTKKFVPLSPRGKAEVSEWLFWQMAGLGPMAGQNHHFNIYAPEKLPYAQERYIKETKRLYGVLNNHLEGKEWVAAGEYTIADMAIYPWIVPWEAQSINLDDFIHLKRWFEKMANRPAVKKAYELADTININKPMTEEAKRVLFGQGDARP